MDAPCGRRLVDEGDGWQQRRAGDGAELGRVGQRQLNGEGAVGARWLLYDCRSASVVEQRGDAAGAESGTKALEL